jgi:hypothetical protein
VTYLERQDPIQRRHEVDVMRCLAPIGGRFLRWTAGRRLCLSGNLEAL